jgi:inorganic pyrophosphatase
MAIEPVEVVVEIPRGSRNKYEFDKERGVLLLDRVLYSSVHYPTDYGYIAGTLGEDGDPLDALVTVNEPTFPGCHIVARPIGILDMRDEKGPDHKVLAVPLGDPRFRSISGLKDLDSHWLREIENFFQTYKALEDKWTEVVGWEGTAAADRIIRAARERYAGSARKVDPAREASVPPGLKPELVDSADPTGSDRRTARSLASE